MYVKSKPCDIRCHVQLCFIGCNNTHTQSHVCSLWCWLFFQYHFLLFLVVFLVAQLPLSQRFAHQICSRHFHSVFTLFLCISTFVCVCGGYMPLFDVVECSSLLYMFFLFCFYVPLHYSYCPFFCVQLKAL